MIYRIKYYNTNPELYEKVSKLFKVENYNYSHNFNMSWFHVEIEKIEDLNNLYSIIGSFKMEQFKDDICFTITVLVL